MSPPPIEVRDLTVAYDGKVALRHLNHTFVAGTSTAIMGANGSGKTTLLNTLAGLNSPIAGSVVGVDISDIGYVMHHVSRRWMPITVSEVLEMGRYRQAGLLRRLSIDDRRHIETAAERLEVIDLLSLQFHELSEGQRQRVRVARALSSRPGVLLLDEPITGLDLASQQRILDVVADETARGTTVVITTHHLDEARHCDNVLLIATEIVAAGPPEEVLQPDQLRKAFGSRTLGRHEEHDHPHEMILLDDHGHGDHHRSGHEHGDGI